MQASNRAFSAYQKAAIQTASQDRLLIMLYDGLIQSLEQARRAVEAQDNSESHKQLVKSQNIILDGLIGGLDFEFEISASLASLYDYFYRRLIEANVKKDIAPITEVLNHIKDLRETWVRASIQVREQSSTQSNPAGI